MHTRSIKPWQQWWGEVRTTQALSWLRKITFHLELPTPRGLGSKISLEMLVFISRSIVPDECSFIPHQSDAWTLISCIPSVIGLQRAWCTLWCMLLAVSMIHPKLTWACFINAATIPPLYVYGRIHQFICWPASPRLLLLWCPEPWISIGWGDFPF